MQPNTMIYFDYAATTPISDEVLQAMLPYLQKQYGNPSGTYQLAREAKAGVEQARRQVAQGIGATSREIFFTSGGTESNNWAIQMGAKIAKQTKKNHFITSSIEHHAVLRPMEELERQGFEVTYLPVNSQGFVDCQQLEQAIRGDTVMVSIMAVNNEVGTIQNIPKIGEICNRHNLLFHCDGVQAVGKIPVLVKDWNLDFFSMSGHKLNAPKGVGALYIKNSNLAHSLLFGGEQERGLRAGTENVASIVGFGKGLEWSTSTLLERNHKIKELSQALKSGLLEIPRVVLNGSWDNRIAGNVNVSIEGVEGEMLLLLLDQEGIAVSSGSACSSGSLNPSHVLLAMGQSSDLAKGSLRLTLGYENTMEEVQKVLFSVRKSVEQLRGYQSN